MFAILDPERTFLRHHHIQHTEAYYTKHVEEDAAGRKLIGVKKEFLVHRTSFLDGPAHKNTVYRPVIGMVVTRDTAFNLATFDPVRSKKNGRCYMNVLGPLCIQHGQSYPTNGLQWPDHHNTSDFVGILVMVCKGLTICIGQNGVQRVVLDQSKAFSFRPTEPKRSGEEFQDYVKRVTKEFEQLWQTQFQVQAGSGFEKNPDSHPWNTPAFLDKFTFTNSLILSEAYTTDLSLLQKVAEEFPDSGIGAYLSPSKKENVSEQSQQAAPSKKQKVSEQPQQAAQAPLVRLVHPVLVAAPEVLVAAPPVPAPVVVPAAALEAALSFLVPPPPPPASLLLRPDVEKRPLLSAEDAHLMRLLPVLPRCLQALSSDDLDFFQ